MFQRLDNFLGKGLEESFAASEKRILGEANELRTAQAALGLEFPQKEELDLVRENHAAVMRELKRMQDDPAYVSSWEPRTLAPKAQPTVAVEPCTRLELVG